MKKITITFFLAVLIAAGGTLAVAYVMLDRIIHTAIEVIGPEATGVSVQANSVSIAPFSGSFELNSLTLGTPRGFSADRSLFARDIKVRISMASLLKNVIIVEEVIVDGALVSWEGVTGDNHRRIMRNIETYVEGFTQPEKGKQPPASGRSEKPGRNVIIKKVILKNSSIVFVAAGKQIATVPIPDQPLTDIGAGKGGERPEEAIQQTYEQIYAALSRSAPENSRIFRGKLGELEQWGRELLESAGEATAGTREEAVKILQDLRRRLKDLFR